MFFLLLLFFSEVQKNYSVFSHLHTMKYDFSSNKVSSFSFCGVPFRLSKDNTRICEFRFKKKALTCNTLVDQCFMRLKYSFK